MATIHDLIEVTSISANTTYSTADGTILGVVDGASGTDLDDGEFDTGDLITIGGTTYTIDLIQEPSTSGSFLRGDGSTSTFGPQHESNLDVVFLTVSSGGTTRYFILPNDSYGALNVQSVTTGGITDVHANDAAVIGTADDAVNVVCFAAGTRIAAVSPGAEVAVEALAAGDLVLTADHGPQPVRAIERHALSAATLARNPHVRPIRIATGALGPGLPVEDLVVSPQHRILVRSKIAHRMFGQTEVLLPAKLLLGVAGVAVDMREGGVEYYHVVMDRHEVLRANGIGAESLYRGQEAMKALNTAHSAGLAMPGAGPIAGQDVPARLFVTGGRGRRLVDRHVKNHRAFG
ncbi:Hint domain-containing protein [Roseovarius atlanticus]|uniref:Hint domain-containing protein n=1 Tax=Roseovarius atlanticus TaxID=1641875 RepID=UPI001C987DFF|nr:Hint domain-containing protein [Roseovarius atlanticus]MBY5990161.1 Hint domain-containing protein [Roseovarius atlanticus]MBY6126707.1 Hint domain-containing protein [Roseovarius atlanticus]MBY6151201.1 Hint domain-containing protein [Roseovarius atlanticus]